MEYKKIKIEGLEGKDLETANVFNGLVDALVAIEGKTDKSVEFQEVKTAIDEIKAQVVEIAAKQVKATPEYKTLREAIVSEIKSLGVNNVKELKEYLKKNGTKELEIKAIEPIDTTADTDYIGRTNLDNRVKWSPTIANAFIPYMRVVSEMSDKSRFGYVEGSYTGQAGYVGEGVGNANSDSASAAAAFEDYAKVQSVLSVNTEVYEDLPDFADGLITQMQISISKFVDDEALSGDGAAPAGVKHIKGIDAYATEFVATPYDKTVFKPHIGDLISAMETTISMEDGGYAANMAYIHPLDLYRLKREKDNDGQPIVLRDSFGNDVVGNVVLKPTKKVAQNTLRVLDMNVVELRTKRAMQLKMGQILANDAINDKQSAILMARYQILVRTLDKVAILKCSSISAALAVLNKDQA